MGRWFVFRIHCGSLTQLRARVDHPSARQEGLRINHRSRRNVVALFGLFRLASLARITALTATTACATGFAAVARRAATTPMAGEQLAESVPKTRLAAGIAAPRIRAASGLAAGVRTTGGLAAAVALGTAQMGTKTISQRRSLAARITTVGRGAARGLTARIGTTGGLAAVVRLAATTRQKVVQQTSSAATRVAGGFATGVRRSTGRFTARVAAGFWCAALWFTTTGARTTTFASQHSVE